MDGSSFDRLTRFVAADGSRRGLLRSAFAAAIAGAGTTAVLSLEEAEAKSCKAKCNKKSGSKKAQCKKKCQKQTSTAPVGSKQAGVQCTTPSECALPNTCDIPVNDGSGDKRCCAPQGAPCGLKNPDNNDDTSPFCCRNLTCNSSTTVRGTCQ